MKRTMMVLSAFIAAGIFIFGVALPTSAEAQSAHDNRVKLMKTMGGNMKKLKMAPDTQTMVAAAKIVNAAAKKLAAADLWPSGSGGGDTRAKMEIWQDMGGFKANLKGLDEASANLIKVSMGGNLGSSKKAFGAMAKKCGGCHKAFRAPKKK